MKVVIKDGKVEGKPILRAWESFTGWYWFAVEHVGGDIYFGFVIGTFPEWGNFSRAELAANSPMVWELPKRAIDLIDREVDT